MDRMHIFIMQIILAISITIATQSFDLDYKYKWALSIARYVIYILTVQGTKWLCVMTYNMLHNKNGLDWRLLQDINRLQLFMYVLAVSILITNKQKYFAEDFPLIFIAWLIVKYPEIDKKTATTTNYGTGMACSYYEGYLMQVIPSDGGAFGGFEHNINAFEARHSIVVPIKKLFIIITKTLHGPPDLQQFNKFNRETRLESCTSIPCELPVHDAMFQSLDDVEKDVAGVKNRVYKNSAYKIHRRHGGPVYLIAECATPLYTLYRVMKNRALYEDLADVDTADVANDFCTTLTSILHKSSECKDKVELVFFDDEDPDSNLADVLLDRIRDLEPNFEQLIRVQN